MNLLNNIKSPLELLNYMDSNISYGFLGKNGKKYYDMYSEEWNDWYKECIVQSGEEVLKTNIGTCWDQVELERLWFEKNNYNFKTIFIWFEVDRDNDLPTHTFLIYENNGKYYWFEHAFELYKGIHEFDSYEEAIEYVKEKQFEHSFNNQKAKKDDKKYLVCYEYNKPENHLGVNEYIDFVTSKKYDKKL